MIAKITCPSAGPALPRPRLFELLDDHSMRRRIVWVTAPPGAGKTTLASTYLAAGRLPALWYSLDPGDADLPTFFHFLAMAVPRRRKPLPVLTPDRRPGLPVFTLRFFEELGARLPPRALLVFDNYHDVPVTGELDEILTTALVSLRVEQRLLVLSRLPPPSKLARLEATGTLVHVGEDELKLTLDEARRIANLRLKRDTPEAAVTRFYERTRGWVAGLILFLEYARGADGPNNTDLETPLVISEYLGEYFDRLPVATQNIMLRTSLLPRATAQMAVSLSGDPQAAAVLADLARRGAFVVRRDRAYEFHPLLRELLLARVERHLGPHALAMVRRLGAEMCVGAGEVEAAVDLYIACKDWPQVIKLAREQAPGFLGQGRHKALEGWLDQLPGEVRDRDPWAAYWHGASRVFRVPVAAREDFSRAFHRFAEIGDREGQIAAWAAVIQSIIYVYGEMQPLDQWIDAFDGLVPKMTDLPRAVAPAVCVSLMAAMNYRHSNHPRCQEWIDYSLGLLQSAEGDPMDVTLLGYTLMCNGYWRGDAFCARLSQKLLSRFICKPGIPPLARIYGQVANAFSALHEGDYSASRVASEEGLALAQAMGGPPLWYGFLCWCGSCASVLDYKLEEARSYNAKYAACIQPGERGFEVGGHLLLTAQEALVAGDLERALAEVRAAIRICGEMGMRLPEAIGQLVLAEVQVERRQAAEAALAIDRAREIGAGSLMIEAQARLIEAQLALAQLDGQRGARQHLEEALGLGRRAGLPVLSTFIAHPAAVARLCAFALQAGIEVETARALARVRVAGDFMPLASLEDWPWPVRFHLFGPFAIEVNGSSANASGKEPRNAHKLLQILVVSGGRQGREVDEGEVMDLLWPDKEGDKAEYCLKKTIHDLRILLAGSKSGSSGRAVKEGEWEGDNTFVLRKAGNVTLRSTAPIYSDVWALEDLLRQARDTHEDGRKEDAIELVLRALTFYRRGPLLPYNPSNSSPAARRWRVWVDRARERLAAKVARACAEVGVPPPRPEED